MQEGDAVGQATELQRLAARLLEIRRAEERLVRDLQVCIDSTNRLLEQISEQKADSAHGSP